MGAPNVAIRASAVPPGAARRRVLRDPRGACRHQQHGAVNTQ